jgi:hypothetical protein
MPLPDRPCRQVAVTIRDIKLASKFLGRLRACPDWLKWAMAAWLLPSAVRTFRKVGLQAETSRLAPGRRINFSFGSRARIARMLLPVRFTLVIRRHCYLYPLRPDEQMCMSAYLTVEKGYERRFRSYATKSAQTFRAVFS